MHLEPCGLYYISRRFLSEIGEAGIVARLTLRAAFERIRIEFSKLAGLANFESSDWPDLLC